MALRDLAKAWLFEALAVKLGMPSTDVPLVDFSDMTEQIKAMAATFGKNGPGDHGPAHSILLKARTRIKKNIWN